MQVLNMDRKSGSLLLVLILLPYIVSWSEYYGTRLISVPAFADDSAREYQIVNAIDPVSRVFDQPAGQSSPTVPIKFISAEEQKLIQRSLQQSGPDYFKRNDFYPHQPIPVYKISLSVFTSDG